MLGLAAARSSRRYTFAIAKWATCRGVVKKSFKPPDEIPATHAESEVILSDLMRMAKDTDKAELPEASPPELSEASSPEQSSTETEATNPIEKPQFDFRSLGLKYDPATLPLERELTARDSVSEEEYAMTLIHGRSVFSPLLHPRTHGIPVANIHFRSHHIPLLKLFTHFALHAATSLGIPASNVIPLPTQRSLWTVIRSPFVHKKSQENFERKVHKRAIKAWDADPEVVQRWVLYLRKNVIPGVGMKVTTWDRAPLGIGDMVIEDELDTEMENVFLEAPANIAALGEQIVAEEEEALEQSVSGGA